MKTKKYIVCLALPLLSAFHVASAQDTTTESAKVAKGIAIVGDQKIPVYKGVDEVTVNKSADGSFYVAYSMVVPGGRNAKNGEKLEARDRASLIRFYTGKKVFGIKIGKIKKNGNGEMEFKSCATDAAKPSLVFTVASIGEAPGNSVSIGNKCQ